MVARYRRMPHGRPAICSWNLRLLTALLQNFAPHKLRNCERQKLCYCGARQAFELCAPPCQLNNCEQCQRQILPQVQNCGRLQLFNCPAQESLWVVFAAMTSLLAELPKSRAPHQALNCERTQTFALPSLQNTASLLLRNLQNIRYETVLSPEQLAGSNV